MDRQNDYKNQIFYNESGQQVLLIRAKGTKNILPHWHAEIEITYIYQTLLDVNQFTIDENSFLICPGDLLFINPYQIHSMVTQQPDTDESHRLTLILPTSFIEQYCPEISKYWITAPHLAAHQVENQSVYLKLKQAFEQLIDLSDSDNLAAPDANKIGIRAQVLQILSLYLTYFGQVRSRELNQENRVHEIVAYLNEHYAERLTLADLAAATYLSATYLDKYFKRQMSLTIFEYLERIRAYHAYEMLKLKDQSVEDTALDCGFSDSKALNKALKKFFNQTARNIKGKI